jgi:hypothetical protein
VDAGVVTVGAPVEPVDTKRPPLAACVIVPDHVPEPAAQQQAPRVERALLAAVSELDRRPGGDGGADRRQFGAFGDGHRHRRALVAQRAAELPQCLLAGVGVRCRDGDLQRTHLVGGQIEIDQFVRPPIDPVAGLPGIGTAGDLGLDRHADVAQRRLVAFECSPAGLVALGVLAVQFGGDLHEAERFSRLEQQREQVGEALDPVDHQPTTLPVVPDTTGDAATNDASDQSCSDLVCRNSSMP